jgi:hypothetical protein
MDQVLIQRAIEAMSGRCRPYGRSIRRASTLSYGAWSAIPTSPPTSRRKCGFRSSGHSFAPRESQFGTWAHRIAVNRTLNIAADAADRQVEADIEEDTVAVERQRSGPLAATIEGSKRLSPGARTVFMMHDVEGYTHEEIARELGITAGGSKSQLFKARAKLRRLLAHVVDGLRPDTDPDNVAPVF